MGNSTISTGPFSIAMYVYQRVFFIQQHYLPTEFPVTPVRSPDPCLGPGRTGKDESNPGHVAVRSPQMKNMFLMCLHDE